MSLIIKLLQNLFEDKKFFLYFVLLLSIFLMVIIIFMQDNEITQWIYTVF